MEIKRAERFPDHMRIDFVRCHSEKGKGFRWADASWRDQFVIEDLEKWAKSVANFVINFDGKQSPNELRRLRLIVSGNGLDEVGDPRKLITGHLDQIDDELMIHCHQEGESHFLVLNWLISDLKTFVHPYLAKYPAECWMIQCWPDSSVNIVLNPGNKQSLLFSGVSFGHKYRIQLVEEITDGDFAPVPWRDKDMKELCEEIKGWLGISSK